MPTTESKPLKWTPAPNIGYTVVRRPDGGMQFTFTRLTAETLTHWRDFALQHLYDSDRLTRNLYDLRQVQDLPPEAIQIALEANSDPATRNIRLAVVVGNEAVRKAVQEIAALSTPGGAEIHIFTDIGEAEVWLSRPLDLVV